MAADASIRWRNGVFKQVHLPYFLPVFNRITPIIEPAKRGFSEYQPFYAGWSVEITHGIFRDFLTVPKRELRREK
ncbi:hypothetical protein DPMN_075770 [Dreissena polymorpha]|uniref:Uncharacterized protein n=1 Tax=Dreissena polymorpha TaxID=45954 RepID=A0A9D3YIS6_DREPO|nr:hypothetical protein DPMN_075770 [Dreissena polymorpha]